jgi:WD40 repeat protein
LLLTAHAIEEDDDEVEGHSSQNEAALPTSSVLCVWNVAAPSAPQKTLRVSGGAPATRCCFSPSKASVAFAGLADGTVCAWDLREAASTHREVAAPDDDEDDKEEGGRDDATVDLLRSPTYETAGSAAGGDGHASAVTALAVLPENNGGTAGNGDAGALSTFQLVTAEENGQVFVWTVVEARGDPDQHLGLAHWGSVRLVRSLVVDVGSVAAFDVAFGDAGALLVAADGGLIMHRSSRADDHRPQPRAFRPEFDTTAAVRAVSFCPFGGEPYFLAGSDDGCVRLHVTSAERPLISWPGTVDGQPVTRLIWSRSRPCVFAVLDTASRVHLWDLGAGDIYPAHTVQFEDDVSALAMGPDLGQPRQKQLLALGMASGKVEVDNVILI